MDLLGVLDVLGVFHFQINLKSITTSPPHHSVYTDKTAQPANKKKGTYPALILLSFSWIHSKQQN